MKLSGTACLAGRRFVFPSAMPNFSTPKAFFQLLTKEIMMAGGTSPAGSAPTQSQTTQVQDEQTANDLAAYAAIEAAADKRSIAAANHDLAMSGYKQLSEAAQGMPT